MGATCFPPHVRDASQRVRRVALRNVTPPAAVEGIATGDASFSLTHGPDKPTIHGVRATDERVAATLGNHRSSNRAPAK